MTKSADYILIDHLLLFFEEFFENFTNYSYSNVKPAALTATPSMRVTELSRPKTTPSKYRPPLELPRDVTPSALKARLSRRVNQLARPKHGPETWNKSLWKDYR